MKTIVPETKVVTSFLTDGQRILFLKRSKKAPQFPLFFSGVSGRLEEEHPYLQALREIEEETGIPEEKLLLLNFSKPLVISSTSYRQNFKVYPFLFLLLPPVKIKLNRENESYLFSPPEAIPEPTVPELKETLARVLVEPFPYASYLVRIKTDSQKSASTLLKETLFFLLKKEREKNNGFFPWLKKSLSFLRPEMAGFFTLAHSLSCLKAFEKRIAREEKNSIEKAALFLDKKRCVSFVTYSYSSLVEALILKRKKKWKGGAVLVSSPHREGERLYRKLKKENLPVTLVDDFSGSKQLQKNACLLLGCDALFSDGTLCHKAGTFSLALAASFFHKPVVSLCPSYKRYPRNYLFLKKIVARKLLFDLTPAPFFQAF